MKTRLFFAATMAIMFVFSLSTPALAGDAASEKTEFAGTWCRISVDNGITKELPSGRLVRKDGWALMDVTVGNELVDGEFHSYNVTFNMSVPDPDTGFREGTVHAGF